MSSGVNQQRTVVATGLAGMAAVLAASTAKSRSSQWSRQWTVLLLLLWLPATGGLARESEGAAYSIRGFDSRIQHGIDLIYGLQFDAADRYFEAVITGDPDNPLGHFFLAMVTWWRVLIDLDDTTHDDAFYQLLERCIQVCDRRLEEDPDDFDAILFKAGSIGFRGRLRGDRGQYLRAASDGLKCLPLLTKSRSMEPTNKDILFGQGIYNYFAEVMVRKHPIIRPIMWLLPDGDRQLGLQQLREVAEEGMYARTEAAYFLAQIYRVFEEEKASALPFLRELLSRYPDNALFHRYTARTLADLGRWKQSAQLYQEVAGRSRQGRAGYHVRGFVEAVYYLGKSSFYRNRLEAATTHFSAVDSLEAEWTSDGEGYAAPANLFLGMIADLRSNRAGATAHYERAIELSEDGDTRRLARRHLGKPYTNRR